MCTLQCVSEPLLSAECVSEPLLFVCRQSQQLQKYVSQLVEELKRKMKTAEMVNLEVTHTEGRRGLCV